MRVRRVASLLLALMVLWAAPAHAELPEALQAPTDLSGEYDEQTQELRLHWQPPDNTTQYVYHVYEDAVLLANTTATNLTTNVSLGLHVYWVTATGPEGVESRPSPPLYAMRTSGEISLGLPGFQLTGGGGGSGCEAIIVIIDDDPPFLDVGVREECLPPLPCPDLGLLAVRSTC